MNTLKITNYKPKDFAELLGVSVKTLQRWDREGILKANRTPTDRRYYTYDQYLQFKGINTENDNRQIVIYARVSTRNQKDDKYPYGKPQTDEVARGSGNREYGCRRLREKLPNFSGVSFFRAGNSSNRVNAFHICVYVHRCAVPRYIALQHP